MGQYAFQRHGIDCGNRRMTVPRCTSMAGAQRRPVKLLDLPRLRSQLLSLALEKGQNLVAPTAFLGVRRTHSRDSLQAKKRPAKMGAF
jgi:hypothetical protein